MYRSRVYGPREPTRTKRKLLRPREPDPDQKKTAPAARTRPRTKRKTKMSKRRRVEPRTEDATPSSLFHLPGWLASLPEDVRIKIHELLPTRDRRNLLRDVMHGAIHLTYWKRDHMFALGFVDQPLHAFPGESLYLFSHCVLSLQRNTHLPLSTTPEAVYEMFKKVQVKAHRLRWSGLSSMYLADPRSLSKWSLLATG